MSKTQHSPKEILRSNYIRCNSGPMCWSGMGSSQLNLCATFTCRHLNSYFYVGFEPLSHSFQLIILTMNYELTFSTKTDAMRRAVMQFCNTFDHNSWGMGLLNMQFVRLEIASFLLWEKLGNLNIGFKFLSC